MAKVRAQSVFFPISELLDGRTPGDIVGASGIVDGFEIQPWNGFPKDQCVTGLWIIDRSCKAMWMQEIEGLEMVDPISWPEFVEAHRTGIVARSAKAQGF